MSHIGVNILCINPVIFRGELTAEGQAFQFISKADSSRRQSGIMWTDEMNITVTPEA